MDNDFEQSNSEDRPRGVSDQRGGFNAYFNSAMHNALIVGIGFVVQGIALMLFRWGFISSLLYLVGLVAVPILLYTTSKRYFRTQVEGPVAYLSAAAFVFWTFILSLIIAALVYYGTFYYLLNSTTFVGMLQESMAQIKEMVVDQAMLQELEASYSQLTAKSITLSMCGTFFFFGTVYAYIIALFFRRSDPQKTSSLG